MKGEYINRGPQATKDNMKLRKKTEEIKNNRKYLQSSMTVGQNFQQEVKNIQDNYFTYLYCISTLGLLCQTLYKHQDIFRLNDISTLLLLLNLILTSLILIQHQQLLTLSHHRKVSKRTSLFICSATPISVSSSFLVNLLFSHFLQCVHNALKAGLKLLQNQRITPLNFYSSQLPTQIC